jgi:hypothetical protein
VSPRRGDRVTVPPPQEQWDVRFGTGDAADGWEELCRHALANTRRCLETLRADPRSGAAGHDRQHSFNSWTSPAVARYRRSLTPHLAPLPGHFRDETTTEKITPATSGELLHEDPGYRETAAAPATARIS